MNSILPFMLYMAFIGCAVLGLLWYWKKNGVI